MSDNTDMPLDDEPTRPEVPEHIRVTMQMLLDGSAPDQAEAAAYLSDELMAWMFGLQGAGYVSREILVAKITDWFQRLAMMFKGRDEFEHNKGRERPGDRVKLEFTREEFEELGALIEGRPPVYWLHYAWERMSYEQRRQAVLHSQAILSLRQRDSLEEARRVEADRRRQEEAEQRQADIRRAGERVAADRAARRAGDEREQAVRDLINAHGGLIFQPDSVIRDIIDRAAAAAAAADDEPPAAPPERPRRARRRRGAQPAARPATPEPTDAADRPE